MAKVIWKPGTMIYPLPAVLVSCGSVPAEYNILTIAWTGIICSDPALCYISVRPERHSYPIIKKTGAYVINLTTEALAFATDWCGVRSGKENNKFQKMNLTPVPASKVKAPLIQESPINIECLVQEIKQLGSHHMFLSEIVAVQADDKYLDKKTGALDLAKASPLTYSHGQYYALGQSLGKFGFSVQKKNKK